MKKFWGKLCSPVWLGLILCADTALCIYNSEMSRIRKEIKIDEAVSRKLDRVQAGPVFQVTGDQDQIETAWRADPPGSTIRVVPSLNGSVHYWRGPLRIEPNGVRLDGCDAFAIMVTEENPEPQPGWTIAVIRPEKAYTIIDFSPQSRRIDQDDERDRRDFSVTKDGVVIFPKGGNQHEL